MNSIGSWLAENGSWLLHVIGAVITLVFQQSFENCTMDVYQIMIGAVITLVFQQSFENCTMDVHQIMIGAVITLVF